MSAILWKSLTKYLLLVGNTGIVLSMELTGMYSLIKDSSVFIVVVGRSVLRLFSGI